MSASSVTRVSFIDPDAGITGILLNNKDGAALAGLR
jgi:hypothetical protein